MPRRSSRAWSIAACCLCVAAMAFADGKLTVVNGYKVLTLRGTPAEMGRQHGELLRGTVQRVVRDVIEKGAGGSGLKDLLDGAMVMERYLSASYRAELKALAAAAKVDYRKLVALQLFGDVNRGQRCSSYAVFGPATASGECIVGRNMDYWDYGASKYAAVLIEYRPTEGHAFLTCSWAGIINGWTALNDRGIFCSNNSAYGGTDALDGLSTCFMVRKVAQFAASVIEGIDIVRSTRRACGTNLLIAGGDPPDAAIVEYDHDQVAVRKARDGYVIADNSFRKLGRYAETDWEPYADSRYGVLLRLIRDNYGRTDRTMNFASAPGVPMRSINLHSALVFTGDRTMYVSMGKVPAADQPYRGFKLTADGVIGAGVLRP